MDERIECFLRTHAEYERRKSRHEAGHAAVGHAMAMHVAYVSIEPGEVHAHVYPRRLRAAPPTDAYTARNANELFSALAVLFAGFFTERRYFPDERPMALEGAAHDLARIEAFRRSIALALPVGPSPGGDDDVRRFVLRAARTSHRVVATNERFIRTVSGGLLRHGRLESGALRSLWRWSGVPIDRSHFRPDAASLARVSAALRTSAERNVSQRR